MRKVFLAGEEAQEWAPLLGDLVADCPAEHWVLGFQCVQDGALRRPSLKAEAYFGSDSGQCSQMLRENDANRAGTHMKANPARVIQATAISLCAIPDATDTQSPTNALILKSRHIYAQLLIKKS
jgi:hypothetical protein